MDEEEFNFDPDGAILAPVVPDQALYSRCLFKTIPVAELIQEVKKRYIKLTNDESYHVLTLKLRAHMLSECGSDPKFLKPIIDELRFLGSSTSKKNSYKCCFQAGIMSLLSDKLSLMTCPTRL